MQMLNSDQTAFVAANGFVSDSEEKLKVFQSAFASTHRTGNIFADAEMAVKKASIQWSEVYEPDVK
tara:strand:- start:815 stop:1012 length:198 start_codon:yes stop_codon:yes gene_type:complete